MDFICGHTILVNETLLKKRFGQNNLLVKFDCLIKREMVSKRMKIK